MQKRPAFIHRKLASKCRALRAQAVDQTTSKLVSYVGDTANRGSFMIIHFFNMCTFGFTVQ
jgi:hypothetical protein